MPRYCFGVRETTIRTAYVDAPSCAEARAMLEEWANENNPRGFSGEREPLIMGDQDTIRITFTSVSDPSESA
jgi:hypothetical protein